MSNKLIEHDKELVSVRRKLDFFFLLNQVVSLDCEDYEPWRLCQRHFSGHVHFCKYLISALKWTPMFLPLTILQLTYKYKKVDCTLRT